MLVGLAFFDAFKRLDGLRPGDWAGFSGPNVAVATAQQARFDELSTSEVSAVAVVFAGRQLDEQQAVAAKGKLGVDRRPWYRVGLVAAADLDNVQPAVLAQRRCRRGKASPRRSAQTISIWHCPCFPPAVAAFGRIFTL